MGNSGGQEKRRSRANPRSPARPPREAVPREESPPRRKTGLTGTEVYTCDSPRQLGKEPSRDYTHGKMWPGTYHLGPDHEALRAVQVEWLDVRCAKLHSLRSPDGSEAGAAWYRAVSRLGKGGQGAVWLCRDEQRDGAEVAVKVFNKKALREDQLRSSLHNPAVWHEFQLLKRVQGETAIVQTLGIMLESADDFFMPMEYIPGVDLHDRLWPKGGNEEGMPPLDPRAVWRTLIRALTFCHARGVVHRDIKPTNLMLCPDPGGGPPVTKLMDFGLGAEVPTLEDGSPRALRRPVGTPGWCAPEVLRLHQRLGELGGLGETGFRTGTKYQDAMGLRYYARPADVWSSGVLLWELLTRNPLFQRSGIDLVLRWRCFPDSLLPAPPPDGGGEKRPGRRADDPRQPPLWEQLPAGAQGLLRGVLVPEPQQRPTCADISGDAWLQDTAPMSPLAPAPSPRAKAG